MNRRIRYRYNKETFNYEVITVSGKKRAMIFLLRFSISLILSAGYYYLYSEVIGLDSPKYSRLKEENGDLKMKLSSLESELYKRGEKLYELQVRDNNLYRPLFGMDEIPADVRMAGFGGVDTYERLDRYSCGKQIKEISYGLDRLYSMAYVQSRSLEDISYLVKKAGEMSTAMPAISPVMTDGSCRYSSSFGYRADPWTKKVRSHTGVDLSGKKGTPIYVTGDGVVVKIAYDMFGYGRFIVVDHGFGYKTKYAHLDGVDVKLNQKVSRGEQIARMGNTGRSSGTHLHYEILYKDRPVNPMNYFNLEMNPEEYASIISNSGTDERI